MKIISGKNRGYKILFTKNINTRPTSNIVKESIFNIIQFNITNANFLDLFSGSGQIGIEALSRGAKKVVFVDNNKECNKYLKKNLDNIKMMSISEIVYSDSIKYIKRCDDIFDIVFIDPPYNYGLSQMVMKDVVKKVNKNGIIICETEKMEELDDIYGQFYIHKTYLYGKRKLTVYRDNVDF